MRELLTVIVAVYNVEAYVEKCILSILNQTYENLQIILVDDGSEDQSGEICDKYAKQDQRITVIHQKNRGLSSARNSGLRIAKGNFIGFVDGDDYIDNDMYENMIGYMYKNVDIVACGMYIIYPLRDNRLNYKTFYTEKPTKYDTYHSMKELLKGQVFTFSVCNKLFRRRLFDRVHFLEGRTSEDIPVVYSLFKECKYVVNTGCPHYYYYQRGGSISRSEFRYRRIDQVLFIRDILVDVRKKYPSLQKQAEVIYIRVLAETIHDIENCSNRGDYVVIEQQLRRVMRSFLLRILGNQFFTIKQKVEMITQCY